MKICVKIIFFVLLPVFSLSQESRINSLREIFFNATNDSVLYESGIYLYDYYEELNRDSAIFYADQCVQVSRKNNKKLNEAYSLTRKAYQEVNLGRYAESLNNLLSAFSISENAANEKYFWAVDPLTIEHGERLYALACAHHIYAVLMRETLNTEQQLAHFKEAKKIAGQINSP